MASNAQLGKIILLIAIVVFFYYFFWVAILPFMILDEGEYQNKQQIRINAHLHVSVCVCVSKPLVGVRFFYPSTTENGYNRVYQFAQVNVTECSVSIRLIVL